MARVPIGIRVVLTLGVAIGINSAAFSLIGRVALRPLPVEAPDRLVMLTAAPLPVVDPSFMMGGGDVLEMDYPLFRALRERLASMYAAALSISFGLACLVQPFAFF